MRCRPLHLWQSLALATMLMAGDGAAAERTLTLRPGETAAPGPGLPALRFLAVVSDSRCPAEARCVWEGEARVLVLVTPRAGAPGIERTLSTLPERRSAEGEGWRVTLEALEPLPDGAGPLPQGRYVGSFRLEAP